MARRTRIEEFGVSGEQVASAARGLFSALLVRRLAIKTRRGKTLLWVPLIAGVFGIILLPLWAIMFFLAALIVRLRIVVERAEEVPQALPAPCPGEDSDRVTE